MNQEEQGKKMQQIIAKAWMDEDFKQRLLTDPAAVLKEGGFELPAGMEVRMVENTDKVLHLVLPAKPASEELSDEQMEKVAGGMGADGGWEVRVNLW
jgi:hypothetical protein